MSADQGVAVISQSQCYRREIGPADDGFLCKADPADQPNLFTEIPFRRSSNIHRINLFAVRWA
jgi:hypothetical protein